MSKTPQIASILNVTPDSFTGDGILKKKDIIKRIDTIIKEGADIIDIGAESTAPGSELNIWGKTRTRRPV